MDWALVALILITIGLFVGMVLYTPTYYRNRPKLGPYDDEGFIAACLVIQRVRNDRDGRLVINAVGYNDVRLNSGLKIALSTDWTETALESPELSDSSMRLQMGKAWLCSTGWRSNRFVRELDQHVYKLGFGLKRMRKTPVEFTSMVMEGSPSNSNQPLKLKLFHDDGSEEGYYEFYLNIDLRKKRVWIIEKDDTWREPFLLSLAASE